MGAADEQPAGTGRGTGADGIDLQLSFFDAHIPTEVQQIEKIDQAESEKTPSAFSLSQAEIENELRKHGSGFMGGKQRIMAMYQTQPDRSLRAKTLAKEYGIGGHSHDYLDGSRGFVNHDWKGLEFVHYPDHQKITLKWAQVEKYIDLMIQSDRYLTDEEKEQRTTVQEENGYKVGDDVMVDLPTGTIEGTIGYIGETDVRIDTSAHGQSWDNEVINKRQFEDGLRQNEPSQRVDKMLAQAEAIAKESEVPEYERFSVRKVVDGKMPLFAIWDDLYDDYYETNHAVPQFSNEKQAESYLENLKKEVADREAAEWLKVEHAKFLADKDEPEPSDEELDELPISTVIDGEVQTFPDAAALDKAVNAEPESEPVGNFHITDEHLGEGGAKQKYARNIEAIKTLFQLEQEHRGATAEEQQVLSQYVGWGGLADAFDPGKDSWAKEYAELKGLLSEDEYAAARSSTLNAHYTSPVVIRSIYDAVEKMGFQSGNILEPSMGVGNFFGILPDSMQSSCLYGVELDSITGRIAKKLYPQADITVAGFETTDRRDFYDLAVGNVPFGQYKVNDKAYNKLGFSIHNYFFAKAIDQVRPGGVVAFVTSRYTMDSKDSTARKHMAERADLLGAIRLPNNAFKANAGTDVVSDIIFLQKRDRPADIEPAWVQLGKTEDGFAINQYFVDHPEMVLGELTAESTQYGREELTVAPIEGANLADQLAEAVQHIEGNYTAVEIAAPDVADAEAQRKTLPADPTVKNFSYTVVDGEIYYRENSIMTQIELSDTAKGRVTGMVELRQIVNELIDQQLNDFPDEDIKETQAKLNAAYDAFTAKYGLINDKKNARLFDDDSSYYLLCSLENLDENKNLKSKADMFTKRTIRPERVVTSVDTPSEALAVSIGEHGKVDLPYMAELLGTPGEYRRITTELSGVIFKDPAADADDPEAGWQPADEYLSGNVRNKLRMAQLAAESHPEFKINVEALTKAQPKDLEASEIDIRLGATWLNPAIVQQFMMETFQPPYRIRYNNLIQVRYSPFTSEWRIGNKSAAGMYDIMSTETYGTHRANAYKILEDTLNLRDCRIYDTIEEDGKERRVLNQKETMLAQQKQQAIKDTFAGWVWQDPQRRNLLVKQYNELFNSTRPREYDGSHIHFVGMNPEINLREHQRNAVAHVLYGGNTLLAHEVGAGKSFEMAASAMESKRLGLCQKSLFVVPNHLTEQWASEFLRLYPNAKLLVTSKKDFEPANRKRFCARITTGDYDAVIIGHSQFEKIPLSAERQARIIEDQIEEIENAIAEAKEQSGEHFTVKQMEKTRKTLEVKLKKLQSTDRKDDVVTFEQLGVDRLFVDESQNYKNRAKRCA
jgi:N12 class adenine-specific DNA methylase/adenine-specific DNA methylase